MKAMNRSQSVLYTVQCLAMVTISSPVSAQNNSSFHEAPRGAGTETGSARVGDDDRVREGVQLAGFAGVGYGVGVGARVGYVWRPGVYVGGAFTYYSGNASFLGAELGYKLLINRRWELEPYVFGGAAFISQGDTGFGQAQAATVGALQPGFLGAHHFGPAFLFAELRAYVTPSPGALAALGGLGVTL